MPPRFDARRSGPNRRSFSAQVDAAEVPRADRAPALFTLPKKDDDAAASSASGKRKRADALPRAELRSKLFGVFAAGAQLSLKDVNAALGSSAQPEAHLKDVLNEVAAQVRVSGRVHYDLKPEYRDHTAAPAPAAP